jgi:hypothetical protein
MDPASGMSFGEGATMKTGLWHGVVLVCVIGLLAVPGAAQQNNAADWYQRAIEAWLGGDSGEPFMSEADWDALWAFEENPGAEPSPQLRAVLGRASSMLADMERGSQAQFSDFGLDYSQGFELLLPHIGAMRGIAKLMHADAMVHLHDGDMMGAADRIATMYSMGGHSGDDRVLISSLVGQAIWNHADSVSQYAFDRAQFDAGESMIMLSALNRLDATDPFQMIEGLAMEQALVGDWLAGKFASPEARAQYIDQDGWLTGDAAYDQQIAAMSEEDFLADIEQYDALMQNVVRIFEMDDRDAARQELAALEQQCVDGEYGLMAMVITPSMVRLYENYVKGVDMVADRKVMLEELARGEVQPIERANAAVFYEQAIAQIRELPVEAFDHHVLGEPIEGEPQDTPEEFFERLQGAMDLAVEGSTKRRCDFAYLRDRDSARRVLCHPYVAGMRDLLRFVEAHVQRALDEGEIDTAVGHLETLLRVLAHLSGDETMLSALTSEDALHTVARTLDVLLALDACTVAHRQRLLHAVEQFSRKDPLGYNAAINALRDSLARSFWTRAPVDDAQRDHWQEVSEYIKALPANDLVYLLGVLDTVRRAGEEPAAEADESDAAPSTPDPLTRMTGLLDFEALVALRDQAEAVAPLLENAQHQQVMAREDRPAIVDIEAHQRAAQSNLRRVLLTLRRSLPEEEVEPAETDTAETVDQPQSAS